MNSTYGQNLNLFSAALANSISINMNIEEISLLSILFSAIGDSLGVIAAARAITETADKLEKKTGD